MSFFGRAAWVIACSLIAACGGKVQGPDTTGTSNGTAGSSGTVFGGMGAGGDPGPGQSSPGSPAGGSATPGPPDTPATCQAICDRAAQAGCVVQDCVNECTGQVIANPACGPQFDAALKCFARAPIGCSPMGEGVTFFGCDPARDLVNQCVNPNTTPPRPGMPDPTRPIPPQCMGGAPVPPSGMVCSGGGSGSGTGGTGGGAPPTCQAECDDGRGNVWSSYCVGANCSCIYNGKTYCTCVSSAPCSSCCPGI